MGIDTLLEERCKTAPRSSKHYREGWVNLNCPYCGRSDRFHLGFNKNNEYFNCWVCGKKPLIKTLSKLIGVNYQETVKLLKMYKKGRVRGVIEKPIRVSLKNFKLPPNCYPIMESIYHFRYLLARGFTKEQILKLEKDYYLKVTTIGSEIDNIDLRYRIVAPIIYKGEVVSWQTRDVTGKSKLPYIACPMAIEKIEHQTILYNAPKSEFVILCEGIFDVWKVHLAGYPATCCFGVEYTQKQLNELIKNYKRIYILFDPDNAGQTKAKELQKRLIFAGKLCEKIDTGSTKDPGDLDVNVLSHILKGKLYGNDF